ncbi:MAG: Rossmann-like and DUF2520 domain-containing protein [Myxococcota bacterium]|nr:Rossmann-like and DUF2520 domain-containing protein [Myxococcota bacterium]
MRMPLAIIGPGRLGRSAARILNAQGAEFVLIGRGERAPAAAVTWLTVPDRAIAAVAAGVPPGGVVLHASGAADHRILRPHPCVGSLHPLMSFPGPEIGMPQTEIPAAVAGDDRAIAAATDLAQLLGFSPVEVPGDRALYHAAAVTAGNFATVLLVQASRMLSAAGVSQEEARALLGPLAITSLKNAIDHGAAALPGPVARGDNEVIDAHLDALTQLDPALSSFYRALCESTRAMTTK